MSVRKVGLDACIFIREEEADDPDRKYGPEVYSSIQTLMNEIEVGKALGIVSAAIFGELLFNSYETLRKRFDSRKGTIYDVDPPIAALARDIRRAIREKERGPEKERGKCLDLGDCLHLATSKIYGCECFVTIEGYNNGKFTMLRAAPRILKEFGIKVITPMAAVDQQVMDLRMEAVSPISSIHSANRNPSLPFGEH